MKQLKLALLGFGVAGKAFSRILVEKHDDILADTGVDVTVRAAKTAGERHTAEYVRRR